jgi:hypothetical protein
MAFKIFKSTETGAVNLTGQAGQLLAVLDACLIVNKVYSYNGSAYTDNTTEARLNGGTAFTMFPDNDTNDVFYIGMQNTFTQATFDLATLGSSATRAWEYWNGSAWTTLTVTDGTSGFTADGTVTWTAPGSWATTSVNSVTLYWVRITQSVAPSTNPTVNSVTVTGWLRYFSGTNKAAYRMGAGNQYYFRYDDNGPGAGTYKEARVIMYETMSDVDTGTPANNTLYVRKSSTADSTAKRYILAADDRTFLLFVQADGSYYWQYYFGDFYSFVPSDSYRTLCCARASENSSGSNGVEWSEPSSVFQAVLTGSVSHSGSLIARNYLGTGINMNATHYKCAPYQTSGNNWTGLIKLPNAPNGGVYAGRFLLGDQTATLPHLRGRMRGLRRWLHDTNPYADWDTISGVGELAGKTFILVFPMLSATAAQCALIETSDTLDTN